MGNTYVLIDEQNWKRAMHCKVFRDCVEPAFCVSFELDITNFCRKFVRNTTLYVCDDIQCDGLRQSNRRVPLSFLDGKVVLYDQIDTAFAYLDKETELFKVVNVPMEETLEKYLVSAAKKRRSRRNISQDL